MNFSDLTPEHFDRIKKYFYGIEFSMDYFKLFKEITEFNITFTTFRFGKEEDVTLEIKYFLDKVRQNKYNGVDVETAIENSKILINNVENKIVEINNLIEFYNNKSLKSITARKQCIAGCNRQIKFLNKIIIDCKNLK